MSKLALIAAVALHSAGRGAAADRAVDQVTAIKSKAIQAIARARAAGRSGPEKADDRRDVSTQASAAATTLPRLQRAVSGEKFCEESGFSEDECKSYNSAACECDWDEGQCWWQGGACGGDDDGGDDDDDVPTPGICATSWTSFWDAGCETAQSGCPPVACDGDDEPWCCNEGFEVSCLEWHYCGDVSGDWDDDGVVGDCLDEGGWARCLTTAYEKGDVTREQIEDMVINVGDDDDWSPGSCEEAFSSEQLALVCDDPIGVCGAEWGATVECLLREAAARAGQTCDTKGACAGGASSDSDAARGGPAPALLVAVAVAAAAF